MPELLVCVRDYGPSGATLIDQPASIFDHPRADAVRVTNGGRHVVVPLFTAEEAPSDLSAEIAIDVEGTARITDVRVL
jgi:hypothetical protein